MSILLGAVGDDLTGSTDLALMLAANGMQTVQYLGVPQSEIKTEDCQAAVVALKSRTVPIADAVAQSLAACDWLLEQGAGQIFFKYCSTFDSTEQGNIGPVAEALLDHLEAPVTVVCPAFPANARSVFQGHLFVGDRLLSESGMRHHPLTPMTDPDLVRYLGKQVSDPDSVGLIPYEIIEQGHNAIAKALKECSESAKRFVILDALKDEHLHQAGIACAGLKLITGGSGIAMGLPGNFRERGLMTDRSGFASLPKLSGKAAVLAGSCSVATRAQVKFMATSNPALALDPLALSQGSQNSDRIIRWAETNLASGPVLIYSSSDPDDVARIQVQLGQQQVGQIVEQCMAEVARGLVALGVDKLIVAGGETSGAVVQALEINALHIGPQIDPGVPWTVSSTERPICLALKSGNFGTEDFFTKALDMLP